MEAKSSKFAVKLLPSLTDFAFLMPIFFLFARMNGLKTLLGDCDTGWHIRTGEWILAHHWVPTHDIFSYSKPDGAWYAWEWLTDVTFGLLFRWAGLKGIVLFAGSLIGGHDGTIASVLKESLTIAGWVAMWRPMQIYLYDWWPLVRRGRIFDKMSRMKVEVVHRPEKTEALAAPASL